jgi:hypothetical protein
MLLPDTALLYRLSQEIKADPLPAAVLWVETTLRPGWVRAIEYSYLKICAGIAPHRASKMTVGLAQMKVCLWQEFLSRELNNRPSIADLENPVINYYAVRWYLSRKKTSSFPDISLIYTGEVNEYYIMLLDEAFSRLLGTCSPQTSTTIKSV